MAAPETPHADGIVNYVAARLMEDGDEEWFPKQNQVYQELALVAQEIVALKNYNQTIAAIDDAGSAGAYTDGKIDEFRMSNGGLVINSGFGVRVLGIFSGRISSTTSAHSGTNDFEGATSDLGTNTNVYCHIPINRAVYCEIIVKQYSITSIESETIINVVGSDTWVSLLIPNTTNRTINIDATLLATSSDPVNLFGAPVLSLSATPPA